MKTITKITSYKNAFNVNCTTDHRESFQEPITVPYTIWLVIFVRGLFLHFCKSRATQEIKTTKFQCPCAPVSKSHFDPALSSHPSSNRNLLASVPFIAIAQAIWEIKVLHKHRRMNWTLVQGQEWKQLPLQMPWVQGYTMFSLAAPAYLFPILEQRVP